MADTEFQLREETGRYGWTFSGLRKKNRSEMLSLLNDGMAQNEIAERMHLIKGAVSKIRAKLIEEDLITEEGNLTGKGQGVVRETFK